MRTSDRGRPDGAGFTLLETAIALGVLTVVGLALASMILASQRVARASREQDAALGAIRSYVEKMRGLGSPEKVYDDGTTPADYLASGAELRDARG
ncbi:MAG TPA: hypothetical protein VHF22_00170, partial [Planctomycetota bacterium]|nr:hypothetical protein [Planctomycetota bacterium]